VSTRRAVALGSGSYLPDRILTNAELSKQVDTTDEWIQSRTGIKQRHIAADGEMTSDLATEAARRALEMAGIDVASLDMIVVATATPDQTFPSTATRVQHNLQMAGGFAFDVQAVCSGFVYALSVATQFIETGKVNTALVIGAETFSRILDWTDRTTCVLFGDGAGAVVLQGQDGDGTKEDRGILSTELRSDGQYNEMLYVDGGPSSTGTAGLLRMRGKEVFRHAVTNLAAIGEQALVAAGATSEDVAWVVPHQANHRIIEATARKVGVPMEQVILTVAEHGNTSAASIPLALDCGVRDGRIKQGDLLLLEAMGGGFTWGAAALRW
jgi:3-oxoacyl-[acyl-carrier-protein] synthase-3